MANANKQRDHLNEDEAELLRRLREVRRAQRLRGWPNMEGELSSGQRIADMVAATMGSWRFIIIQTTILIVWVALNVTAYVQRWDPYPFILLNLGDCQMGWLPPSQTAS